MAFLNTKPHLFSFLFASFLIFVPYMADTLSFQFPGSNPTNPFLIFEGNAILKGEEIQLTNTKGIPRAIFSIGRVIYKKPIQIWDSRSREVTNFTTQFTFSIKPLPLTLRQDNCDEPFGDGMAFFLAPNGTEISSHSAGGFLGLFNSTTVKSLSNQVVAVEFDTFRNAKRDFLSNNDPTFAEPETPHIGIDVGSIFSNKTKKMSGNLGENMSMNASINYDGVSQVLSVRLSYSNNKAEDNIWSIVDLKEKLPEVVNVGFSAATGSCIEKHILYSWSFDSSFNLTGESNGVNASPPPISLHQTPDQESGEKSKKNLGLVAGLPSGVIVLSCGFFLLLFVLRKRKVKGEEDRDTFNIYDFEKGTRPKRYNYKELALATNNFSVSRKLGQGGFGGVYKGLLHGEEIAVKKISKGSNQGIKEFVSEVKIISQLRHRNLVQLLGWCHERGEFLLVYELMHNGSLDFHLCGKSINSPLPWEVRYNIASGLASALVYLHEEWEQCVVHRDIKSSNVMLDSDFNAKLGDFGLARLAKHNANIQTTRVAGTIGYMAPECIMTGKTRKESDVYSFGIVALEIACGRIATDTWEESTEVGLVEGVWDLYGNKKLFDAVDPKLGTEFDRNEVECLMIVGLWCAHPDYSSRPSMKTVKDVLHMDSPLPTLPSRMHVPMLHGSSHNMEGVNFSRNGGSAYDFLSTAVVASSSTRIGTTSGSSVVSLLEAR